MAKIHAFEVGYCTHPACVALKGSGLRARKFPARAYLLETRSGLYLWDTGYSEQFASESRGIYKAYGWVTPVHYDHGVEQLRLQLASKGVAPADLAGLLISHFHADHVAGLRDFPGVPLFASKEAVDSVRGLSGASALLKGFIPGLLPTDFDARLQSFETLPLKRLPAQLQPFEFGWVVGEDEDIWVVPLPGHAQGHVGAFVRADQGWELLASDAAWDPEGFRELRGPSELSFLVQHNRRAYYKTLEQLHLLHRSGGVRIHLSHEL